MKHAFGLTPSTLLYKAVRVLALLCLLAVTPVMANTAPKQIDDSCWDERFRDDFNTIDFWNADTQTGQWRTRYIWERDTIINNELQYYIDPQIHGVSPFAINDGVLEITASKTPQALKDKVNNASYISGVLTTENGFSQKHGRFEAYAKVPRGRGLWSAFWLLPSFDQWPDGVAVLPEIDVMENLGHEPRTFHTSLHTNQNGTLESHPYDNTVPQVLSDKFHLYSVVWTESSVNWYLDKRWVASHPTPKDFTRPVHMLLNLAVGGSWPGNPDSSTRFPATFSVDYVRVLSDNGTCQ